ncbi:hypothetical protein [Mycolicibacterium austroafricanum]|uniref:hypothetical protein n=1 Tax=Mycolicibacterium austroafricanum TaxID=39687 RepID=UPI00055B3E6A|nr:hypothetical protein [Mycolicibacterium austroafricanum]
MPTYRVFHQALPANINGTAAVRTEDAAAARGRGARYVAWVLHRRGACSTSPEAFAPGVTLEQVI